MPWMTGGGQPIPAGLSYPPPPPPMIFEHWLAMILLLLLIALTTINGFVSQNTDTACQYKKSHFMKFFIYRWGATYPSWFTLPPTPLLPHHHPGHCSSKFLHIMEWVFSASWVKLMKISCYRNIFCLFTTTSHYQCLGWRAGGNLSQLVYLTPHPRLWSSDCAQRMKTTSSTTLVKIMKIP